MAEYRFLARWLQLKTDESPSVAAHAVTAVEAHLAAAKQAAEGRKPRGPKKLWSMLAGASVERAMSHLDAAETDLLRLAPEPYLRGQMPSLLAHVEAHLAEDDPRRVRIEEIADRGDAELGPVERGVVLASVRAASTEARREVTRVRSFRNTLYVGSIVLAVAAAGLALLGSSNPSLLPLCFNPDGMVVCPTLDNPVPGQTPSPAPGAEAGQATGADVDAIVRNTAGPWDVFLVELLGLIAAAIASAATLRNIRGTSTPYSLPIALAVLKLPTGALTAVLGLLLMRGDFVPGLSALDSSAQILAWAIVFGYAQQLLTRFVDQRAQVVLGEVGRSEGPAQVVVAPGAPVRA